MVDLVPVTNEGKLQMLSEYVRHRLIGTPLEGPARNLRHSLEVFRGRYSPEWDDVRSETVFIDRMLEAVIQDGMNCVDVGSHLGAMVSTMHRLSPSGTVVAVEPLPYKAEWLKRRFPTAVVHQVALSDKREEATFYFQPKASGFSGLKFHDASPAKGGVEELKVRCLPLDDLVPADLPVQFMKVDVEGGELLVFRGARELLRRNRPTLLFECTKSGCASFGYPGTDIYHLLTGEYGYQIFLIKDWLFGRLPLTAEAFYQAMEYPAQAFNFLAQAAPRAVTSPTRGRLGAAEFGPAPKIPAASESGA